MYDDDLFLQNVILVVAVTFINFDAAIEKEGAPVSELQP